MLPERDQPGAIPGGQPRHDNDRRHITGISIMPTFREVVSNARPYLPAADPASWHLSGVSGRFDQQFRLLRENSIGQIRDACQEVLSVVRGQGLEVYSRQRTSTHFDFCDDAKVHSINMYKLNGIEFTVALRQPNPVRHMADEERRIWWEKCKRFRPGTLVCVLDRAGYILHFVVAESTLRGPAKVADHLLWASSSGAFTADPSNRSAIFNTTCARPPDLPPKNFNLSRDREWSYVNLKLVDSSKISDALLWYADTQWRHYLLDFPDVMLDSFKYTLEALQRDCQSPHRLVISLNPDSSDTRSLPVVAKPAYARSLGFTFNLDCLMPSGHTFQFDPSHAPTQVEISSLAHLEFDQATALLRSLSSDVAFIGGLPGTGKSFLARRIIKALVHNRENADLGPIICIFKDHAALDHMVDQLLEDGIKRIFGVDDPSTSDLLQSLGLLTSYAGMCTQERRIEEQMREFLDKLVSDIQRQLWRFTTCVSSWKRSEVFGSRRGDFSDNQLRSADAVRGRLTSSTSRMEDEFATYTTSATLGSEQRQREEMLGILHMRDCIIQELIRDYDEYNQIRSELPRFHDDARRQNLQNANVVVATTAELVRRPELLQPIQAKVLVCDDAEGFQESQILTAILPSAEHIILLGNHEVRSERLQRINLQGLLDPLELSFFERLVHATPYRCSRLSHVPSTSPTGESSQDYERPMDCGRDCLHRWNASILQAFSNCTEPCPRPKSGCDHTCPLTCGEPCEENCLELIEDIYLRLPCGHVLQSASCWQVQEPHEVLCDAEVDYNVPGCNHKVKVSCHKAAAQNSTFTCLAKCGATFPCGHTCQRNCHRCNFRSQDTFSEGLHDICDQACGRSIPNCAHFCQLRCHGESECGPCEQPCDVRCSHGRCERLCHEPCIPCTDEHCDSSCPHSKCTLPCAAPCNWVPCSRRCTMLLNCGHQCPSLCGEACPDSKYCQNCGPEDVLLTTLMNSSGMKDYRDIDLDEDPCVFPHCGHFQTRSSMDEQLRMQDVYNLTDDGLPSSIKDALSLSAMQKVACCTRCRSSLRDICRYGRIIRRPILDETLEEFLSWRNAKFSALADRLTRCVPALNRYMAYRGLPNTSLPHQDVPIELNGNMQNQIHFMNDLVGDGRYTGLAETFKDIQNFSWGELRPKESIFQKAADTMRLANGSTQATAGTTDNKQLQLCGDLFAMDLSLRSNITVLDDFLRLWRRESAASTSTFSRPTIQLNMTSNFRGSREFIRRAQEANQHIFAARGHVYIAWYCGFALALLMDASMRERPSDPAATGCSQSSVSQQELRARGEEHLAKADELYRSCLQTSKCVEDGIEATRDFIRSGNLGSLRSPQSLWYTNFKGMYDGSGPWYFCDNGHFFMDLRKASMFIGQLRCRECGLIVAGREDEKEDGVTIDTHVALPAQGEKLVDI